MQLNSKILLLLSLTCALLLVSNFGVFILGQLLIAQAILIFNLREGGSRRGSTSFATSISLFALDLTAYFVWRWQTDLSFLEPNVLVFIMFLPMVTRLLVPFFSPWARLLFANSSIEISILYLCTSFLPAVVALARYHGDLSFIAPIASLAGFFAALLVLADKHLSQFLMRTVSIAGALALYLLSSPLDPISESKVLAYCGTVTMLVCLGLLIQRPFLEEIPEKFERALRPIWYIVLILIGGLPYLGVGAFIWQIFPSNSPIWLTTFVLFTFAVFSRVRVTLQTKEPPAVVIPTIYNRATIANLWVCLSLIVLVTLSLQMLFSQVVLPK